MENDPTERAYQANKARKMEEYLGGDMPCCRCPPVDVNYYAMLALHHGISINEVILRVHGASCRNK